MNITLIGYRGTGKSTIAEILGDRLSMRVVCMDAEIVTRAGKTIPEIVEESGWDHFRDIESQLAADLGSEDGLIIDAGGGIIVRPKNIESLKKNGLVFWLVADEQTIVDRIKDDTQRPSLSGSKSFVDEVAEILSERTPKYKAAADHTIDTVQNTAEQAAATIAELFLERRK
ncbi:MAG: shikimate kinase [Planctomycetota bacterium]|jgi:shikimate kinase